jgi:hypothetical protein
MIRSASLKKAKIHKITDILASKATAGVGYSEYKEGIPKKPDLPFIFCGTGGFL